MKRIIALGLFVLGFATAGVLSGTVIADSTTSSQTTTATSTTTVTTTTAATTTAATTTTTTTTTPVRTETVPADVRVAGVAVGGLTPKQAVAAVRLAYLEPLAVVVDSTRLELDPATVSSAYIATAVAKARVAGAGADVPVVVAVRGGAVRAWVAKLVRRFRNAPVDAALQLRNGRPWIRPDRPGHVLDGATVVSRVVAALQAGTRRPVRVRTRTFPPKVKASVVFAHVIVVNRSTNRLQLYAQTRLVRTFPVATGQSIYPTPLGRWHIVVKEMNPWWYPPVWDSWAKGLKPVPPGPSNPLGTRWMGLDAPGVGIHGTDEPASIGYSASHGCIRMQVPDAEWLYQRVAIGTTVFVI